MPTRILQYLITVHRYICIYLCDIQNKDCYSIINIGMLPPFNESVCQFKYQSQLIGFTAVLKIKGNNNRLVLFLH